MAASDAATADRGRRRSSSCGPQDADGVWPLSVEAGWNQVAADWRLMIASGSAFGIQDAAGRWIASALALPLGSEVSWISMVLVTKPERRKGHGTRLLRRCIAAIEAAGRAMGLDATEFGRPVYLPLGFRDLYAISRWSVPSAVETPIAAPPGIAIRPARSARSGANRRLRPPVQRVRTSRHSGQPARPCAVPGPCRRACRWQPRRLQPRPRWASRNPRRAGDGRGRRPSASPW